MNSDVWNWTRDWAFYPTIQVWKQMFLCFGNRVTIKVAQQFHKTQKIADQKALLCRQFAFISMIAFQGLLLPIHVLHLPSNDVCVITEIISSHGTKYDCCAMSVSFFQSWQIKSIKSLVILVPRCEFATGLQSSHLKVNMKSFAVLALIAISGKTIAWQA